MKTIEIKKGLNNLAKRPVNIIPKNWEWKTLQEFGIFSKGKGILKEQVIETGLPCIRYGEIYTTHDFIVKKFKSFISQDVAEESQEIKKNDVLFAGSGETLEEIGKAVAYVGNQKAYAGGDVVILSTNGKVDTEWLAYALESDIVRRQKRRLGQGHSVVHIYPRDLSTLWLPCPPKKEQEAISCLINLIDSAISKSNLLIAKKELQKKGLQQALLTGKKRLKEFKENNWKEYELKDLYKHLKGRLLSKDKLEEFGKYKCILYGELFTTYDEVIYEVKSRTSYNEGTLSMYGDLLMPGSTTTTGIDLTVTSAVLENGILLGGDINIFRMKNELTEPVFMSYYLTHTQKRQILRMPQGITIIHLYGSDLLGIKLSIPSKEEQLAISKVLVSADKEIQILKMRTEKMWEKKKGLMQNLLTGKKRLI